MHKKLAADLTSLAHSILQMKNKEDVFALKTKAHQVYEKLALLAYVEEYINNTPNATTTKEVLLAKIIEAESSIQNTPLPEIEKVIVEEESIIEKEIIEESAIENEVATENITIEETLFSEPEQIINQKIESDITEQPFDELEGILFSEDLNEEVTTTEDTSEIIELSTEIEEPIITEEPITVLKEEIIEEEVIEKEVIEEVAAKEEVIEEKTNSPKQPTLEEELGDTISVDVMANLFEKAPPKTLNDRLFQDTIKIDLNDRIAFVKNLFDGNQEDFNRVISQLNTIKTEKSAKQFITKMIKPDYDWSDKEAYEARLLEIIERRFS